MINNNEYIFTSESVSEGHPDKMCDQISDAILDACLRIRKDSKVACEVLVVGNKFFIGGEIKPKELVKKIGIKSIVQKIIKDIGYYDLNEKNLSYKNIEIINSISKQSSEISKAIGVNSREDIGAGDQGIMYGYATDETEEFMPLPILLANKMIYKLTEFRKNYINSNSFLRPDAKSQISVKYNGINPISIEDILVSHQHASIENPREKIEEIVKNIVEKDDLFNKFITEKTKYHINTGGSWKIGGPIADTGLTGRKIIVDTYGTACYHGGGCFSGKDPSKVDRSGAYMCRYIAKNIVAAKLAKKCEVCVCYAFAKSEPLHFNINTYNTGLLKDSELKYIISKIEKFDLRPSKIISNLGLNNLSDCNWCYQDTAVYGHFGRDKFPWEKTDKIYEIHKLVNI